MLRSLDLVERLYADLLKSSSSCQALQEEATRLTSDLMLISPQIHTLRKENSQIKTENSQLHLDNIKLQEDLRDANEQAQRRMRQLNDDLTAQTLLNKAYEEEMRKKDQVADALRDAYDGVVDPALRTRTLTASSMRISSRLPAADNSGVPVDKAWAEVKAKGQGQSPPPLLPFPRPLPLPPLPHPLAQVPQSPQTKQQYPCCHPIWKRRSSTFWGSCRKTSALRACYLAENRYLDPDPHQCLAFSI